MEDSSLRLPLPRTSHRRRSSKYKKNKSIQHPASAVKVTLLAFAAERRAAVARRSAANPPHAAASVNDETDGRADGQTDGPSTD